jgi:hypothetical protein
MKNIDNDSNFTLGQICRDHGSSLIDLLLDIQKSQITHQKSLPFIRNLDCLKTDPHQHTRLSREPVNAFNNPQYVALSYTWEESEYEDPNHGRYQVQDRHARRESFVPSKVRNCVFDRILKYMHNSRLRLLWMDKHCLQQAICEEADCEHMECNQNREGLEAMDLVYKLSAHPVALLSTPIKSQKDLKTLVRILSGDLVSSNHSSSALQLSPQTTRQEVIRAIMLLDKVTKDAWWKRGWIFQESYRAGRALRLLIPHSPGLETLKLSYGTSLFGEIRGELCISATSFSYEATRLCSAFATIRSPPPYARKAISQIIQTAGRYTVIVGKHFSMSPTIFSDIDKRNLERHWDQLEIAANCCQYSTRLNVQELEGKKHSFSLSKLALYLLNGELLHNVRLVSNPSRMTVLDFISSQSFRGFYAPLGQRNLTFNKGCRLTHVELMRNGILTKGHLWHLGRIIHSQDIKRQPLWVNNPKGMLSRKHRKLLTQLANTLRNFDHAGLTSQIWDYLDRDATNGAYQSSYDTFAGSYMRLMASEVANAIDLGMELRLACIWDPSGRPSPYRAIFVCKSDEGEGKSHRSSIRYGVPRGTSSMVFTASAPKRPSTAMHSANDLDRHVSLEVRRVGSTHDPRRSITHLEINSWILGLCFFEGVERTDVLFPWPPGFRSITS